MLVCVEEDDDIREVLVERVDETVGEIVDDFEVDKVVDEDAAAAAV